ncbi:hypothetical protein DPMN_110075 [Dreissena polymorpha]|uniref:Uncharacterized protein n=1 Tax=Dreissena polymorpha TaxID=45954 RepID=A0A9D4QNJ7_DREPO|nr:hypothetical protein DPMN_110075 [Dreissena polymorpha]
MSNKTEQNKRHQQSNNRSDKQLTFKRQGTSSCGQREVRVESQEEKGQLEVNLNMRRAPKEVDIDRRLCDLGDGLYVKCFVNEKPIIFTLVTGASRTIISTRVYQRLPERSRPSLSKGASLKGACGAPITDMGKGMFELRLGKMEKLQEIIVAEIEDDALLGYDVLVNKSGKPADLLLSREIIMLEGYEIPCISKAKCSEARRATVAEDINIPGNSEALVDVFVNRIEWDDALSGDFLIEPYQAFKEGYQLIMTATMVDIYRSPTCKVRLMNPFSQDVDLRRDAEIGVAKRVERVVSVFATTENNPNESEPVSVRRIQLNQVNTVQSLEGHLMKLARMKYQDI